MPQGPVDTREREIAPRYFFPGEQMCLQTFDARRELRRRKVGTVDQLHLRNAWYGVNGEQALDLDFGFSLFQRLTRRALLRRLVLFEVARRDGPKARSRLDGAAAKKNSSVPRANGTNHD